MQHEGVYKNITEVSVKEPEDKLHTRDNLLQPLKGLIAVLL